MDTYKVYELLKNTRGSDPQTIAREIRKVKDINSLHQGISEYAQYKQENERHTKSNGKGEQYYAIR